jgi:hypothetical protein
LTLLSALLTGSRSNATMRTCCSNRQQCAAICWWLTKDADWLAAAASQRSHLGPYMPVLALLLLLRCLA